MKKNKMEVIAILDESGSMDILRKDTIGGFNSFIETQRNENPMDVYVSLVTFNTYVKPVYQGESIKTVSKLTTKDYNPSGNTALLDAIGYTIDSVGVRLAQTPEHERPSKVMFLIITDGEENASKKFSNEDIKNKITHQKEKYSWEFNFLGANIDSFTVGQSFGIDLNHISNYTADVKGTESLFRGVSAYATGLSVAVMNNVGDEYLQAVELSSFIK